MTMAMDTMGNGRPLGDKPLPLDASVRYGTCADDDPADAGISPVVSA